MSSNKKIARKSLNIWIWNNILLNNTWIKEEISREIIKYFKLNGKENTTPQNLWHAAKAVIKVLELGMPVLQKKKDLKLII